MRIAAGLAAAALLAIGAQARRPADAPDFRVDRVVILMRHGVRPPTKAMPLPAGSTAEPWPVWPVAPGELTPHGAAALRLIAADDRARLVRQGSLPAAGCMRAGTLRVIADSDQRTVATAQAYLGALLPGCTVPVEHRPPGEPDPLFAAVDTGAAPIDPVAADRAVLDAAGRGGIERVEAEARPLLARLDAILCGKAKGACGIAGERTTVVAAGADRRPKLQGALDRASTAAQSLLLEYAEGKPMREVGWGRATAKDIADLSAFHALEFRLLVRPPYLAGRIMSGLDRIITSALAGDNPSAPVVTLISGHDTDIAALAGQIDAHWQVPGLAPDDPAPGGAIVIERLRDRADHKFIRATYRSATIEQIRRLIGANTSAAPYRQPMVVRGCMKDAPCSIEMFNSALSSSDVRSQIDRQSVK